MKNKILINNIKLANADFIKELQDKLKKVNKTKTKTNEKI
jgi:hypothetical protein